MENGLRRVSASAGPNRLRRSARSKPDTRSSKSSIAAGFRLPTPSRRTAPSESTRIDSGRARSRAAIAVASTARPHTERDVLRASSNSEGGRPVERVVELYKDPRLRRSFERSRRRSAAAPACLLDDAVEDRLSPRPSLRRAPNGPRRGTAVTSAGRLRRDGEVARHTEEIKKVSV